MPRFITPDAIEDTAARLRRSAGRESETFDVDIERLANHYGCVVELVQFTPSTVSARVTRYTEGDAWDFKIQVNASNSYRRRRFSVAHELAHVVLHAGDAGDFDFVEYRRPRTDYGPEREYKEVQANMLASALLMPQAEVSRFWRHNDDLDDLAEAFNVSRDSAFWRATNMGLLSDD